MSTLGSRVNAAGLLPEVVPRWRAQVSELAPAGWLFVRLVLGIEWLRGGWEKFGDAGWTAPPVGRAVGGFLKGAIAKSTQGQYPEVPHWFHNLAQDVFLPNAELLAYLVSAGEILVGVGLIVGGLTRGAALFGVTMNAMFLWAGTSSSNPQMLILGLAIVLIGGRAAGQYGLDGWLMPGLQAIAGRWLVGAANAVIVAGTFILAAWLAWVAATPTIWLIAAVIAAAAFVIRTGVKRQRLRRGDGSGATDG